MMPGHKNLQTSGSEFRSSLVYIMLRQSSSKPSANVVDVCDVLLTHALT